MEPEQSGIKLLARQWRWILIIAALLAIPTFGFTTPFSWAVIAYILALLFSMFILLLLGPGRVIEGIIPIILIVVLFAMLSHAIQQAKEKQKRIEQQKQIQTSRP